MGPSAAVGKHWSLINSILVEEFLDLFPEELLPVNDEYADDVVHETILENQICSTEEKSVE